MGGLHLPFFLRIFVKIIFMVKTIEITIEECTDNRLPTSEKFLAYISDGEYRGIVVSAESIPDVLTEIGISMVAKEKYLARVKQLKDAMDN
jgi:hypothetical protein